MDSNLAAYAAYEAEKRRQAEQQQQNQPNLIDALGKLALGTGAAVASYYGIRGLTQRLKTADPFSVGSYAPKPSQVPVDEAAVRRAAGAVPTEVARQQRGIELTRLARAERPQGVRQGNLKDLIESVNVQDLGPAYVPVNPERAKIDLSFINNVLIPMEQKRLPSATDFLQQRLTGQKTDLPVARTPGTFREFSQEASLPGITAANKLAEDADLLREVERQNLENLSEARSFQSKAQAEYRRLLSATVQEEVFDVLKKEANTVQAAAQSDFGPQKFIQDAGYVEADSLVDQHRSNLIGQVDHFANAANSAEDQATGRVKRALQRNEDENLAAVEMAEDAVDTQIARAAQSDPTVASVSEIDAAINQVADGLPDGRPVDQAEGVVVSAGAFAQKQMMQTRMNQLRSELSQQGYRGLALEKELASRTNIKQASELYASTGDPSVLSLASTTPSLPLSVKPKTNLQLGQSKASIIDEDVPTSAFYESFKQRDIESGSLVNADIYYTNKISNLSAKLEGAPPIIDNPDYVNFIEQTNMAMAAMRKGDPTAATIFNRNKALLTEGKAPSPTIVNPEHQSLQNQLTYAEQARAGIREKQGALQLQGERFPTLQKVVSTGEGGRLFGEIDPATGEIIPESLEIRGGRFSLPGGTVSSTATGRAIRGRVGAEGTVAGPTPGIFEPAAVVTESTFKPETARYRGETGRGTYEAADAGKGLEYEAQPVRWDPNIHAPEQRTPEGFVYSEEALVKPSQPLGVERNIGLKKAPMSVAKPSVELSQEILTSRDPQALLRSKMAELGVSAIGEFSPYPRRSSTPATGKRATPAQQAFSRYARFVDNPNLLD